MHNTFYKDSLTNRKTYLDAIRILAIFLVIFNHTPAYHFPYHPGGEQYNIYVMLFISGLTKIAVPLFFMISGAVLLAKAETIRTVLKKRALRILCLIILFQLIQFSFYGICFHNGEHKLNFYSFLSACFSGHSFVTNRTSAAAVWFLYAYLAFILFLPFLRFMVKNMKNEHFYYLGMIQIFSLVVIPCVGDLLPNDEPFKSHINNYLSICQLPFIWVLAGYFIEHRVNIDKVKLHHLASLFALSFLMISIVTFLPEIKRIQNNEAYVHQGVPAVIPYLLIPCITLFLLAKKNIYYTSS
ncbi:MAG: acyltransferase [Clostridia bacterium]|nr:acyltransferase [Clostridia bacterium]